MSDLLISIIYNVNLDNNTTFESNNKVHAWIKVCIVKPLADRHRQRTISQFLVSHWKELQSPPEPVRSKQYTEFEVFSSCSWANSTSGKPLRKYETKNVSYFWFAFRILQQCEWEILRFFNERAYSLRCLVSLNVQHECNAYFSKTRAWDRTLHRSK